MTRRRCLPRPPRPASVPRRPRAHPDHATQVDDAEHAPGDLLAEPVGNTLRSTGSARGCCESIAVLPEGRAVLLRDGSGDNPATAGRRGTRPTADPARRSRHGRLAGSTQVRCHGMPGELARVSPDPPSRGQRTPLSQLAHLGFLGHARVRLQRGLHIRVTSRRETTCMGPRPEELFALRIAQLAAGAPAAEDDDPGRGGASHQGVDVSARCTARTGPRGRRRTARIEVRGVPDRRRRRQSQCSRHRRSGHDLG